MLNTKGIKIIFAATVFRVLLNMRLPAIAYPGGKARLAKNIVAVLPPTGGIFVDLFAGRGNVYFAAVASGLQYREWWINDIQTAPFFEAIKNIGGTLTVPPRSREEYYRQWELFKQDDPTAIVLEPFLTFSGGGYGSGGPGGKKGASAESYQKTLRECHRLLTTTVTRITALDWKVVSLEQLSPEDTVYLDPPYYNADVRSYGNDFDHVGMVKALKDAKFRWLLSEYRQEFYMSAFGEPFFIKDVQLVGTDYSLANGGKERRIECMWKNY